VGRNFLLNLSKTLYKGVAVRILPRPICQKADGGFEPRRASIHAAFEEGVGVETTYAVIKTGGKQYRVAAGDKLRVEKLPGNVGDAVTFKEVLLVATEGGGAAKVGRPLLPDASVEAKIIAQDRAKKIIIFKFRRRKNYRRKTGHRQPFTALEITQIRGT
jgi:large subunit ribosomal protein L21